MEEYLLILETIHNSGLQQRPGGLNKYIKSLRSAARKNGFKTLANITRGPKNPLVIIEKVSRRMKFLSKNKHLFWAILSGGIIKKNVFDDNQKAYVLASIFLLNEHKDIMNSCDVNLMLLHKTFVETRDSMTYLWFLEIKEEMFRLKELIVVQLNKIKMLESIHSNIRLFE